MIHDALMQFAANQRPNLSIGLTTPVFYPLPTGGTLASGSLLAYDLAVAQDKGAGNPLIARFDVRTSFTTSDAAQVVRLGAALTNDTDSGATDLFPLVLTSTLVPTAGAYTTLVAGASYELVIPSLHSALVPPGRRYLILGMEITTTVAVGGSIFTAGGLDAYVMLDGQTELIRYAGGFTV